eukprot:TRINITY_DN21720_c0_g1_i1.p1 TRINITY_DN21720_c0_g1~~TRINITY_DN21720_c0_g1_i1.p1  ORF type:complete len:251 (+),score=57.40 TRINITY_DN21720_c0_g1_i1:38-790(+)
MYAVSADTNDVGVVDVPLKPDFQLDLEGMQAMAVAEHDLKLVFLCSPGNPTCVKLRREDLLAVLKAECYSGMVVVDEAYIDFGGPGASVCDLVQEYPQLVVLQTMSKAWGLAGIRCGFAIGDQATIEIMNKVKAPYNLNVLTSNLALKAFNSKQVFDEKLEIILAEREKLSEALRSMEGIVREVLASDTNFLMFRIDNAEAVYKQMAEKGVVVRYRGNCMHCDGCLRVTIGTPEENSKFLELLRVTTTSQ